LAATARASRPGSLRQAHPDPGLGYGYCRIADQTCSTTTLRRRRDEGITLSLADRLRCACLAPTTDCLAWSWSTWRWTVHHQGALRQPDRPGPARGDRRKQSSKRSTVTQAHGLPLGAVPAPANVATTGCWRPRWTPWSCLGYCPPSRWCTWTPPTTTSPAGRCWPDAAWSATSPRGRASPDPREPTLAGGAHPRLGQPVRQAALVHRAPPPLTLLAQAPG
jgi:hypothetical protein